MIKIAFDTKLRRPACVLIQAALGGEPSVTGRLFPAELWLLAPTPDMRVYDMPIEHWEKVADTISKERNAL